MYKVIHVVETDSTNVLAKEYARNGAVHGTVIVADNQTAGRGRLGKKWQSIAGTGLYCSIIIRPKCNRSEYSKMTLVAGLAVAERVENICQNSIELKWPNDLYLSGRKCGGILCESSLGREETDDFIIIGIGINVNSRVEEFGDGMRLSPVSLMAVTGIKYSIEQLLSDVRMSVLEKVTLFEAAGLAEILPSWKTRDMLAGKNIRCLAVGGRVVEGEALGVDEDGLLYLRDCEGVLHEVLSGDVQAS